VEDIVKRRDWNKLAYLIEQGSNNIGLNYRMYLGVVGSVPQGCAIGAAAYTLGMRSIGLGLADQSFRQAQRDIFEATGIDLLEKYPELWEQTPNVYLSNLTSNVVSFSAIVHNLQYEVAPRYRELVQSGAIVT
jgi:hypothetical protein